MKTIRSNNFIFDKAIAAFQERDGKVIVEIGSIHDRNSRETDGHSTLRWPLAADIWSVDNDPKAVCLTRALAVDRPFVFCVLADAIVFLHSFPGKIDLLYLDGPHPDIGNGREWHLGAYRAARMKMSKHSVILVDDTDVERFGKAEFVIPAAIDDGFWMVESGRQTLLVR